jgi:hypothetical protein
MRHRTDEHESDNVDKMELRSCVNAEMQSCTILHLHQALVICNLCMACMLCIRIQDFVSLDLYPIFGEISLFALFIFLKTTGQ